MLIILEDKYLYRLSATPVSVSFSIITAQLPDAYFIIICDAILVTCLAKIILFILKYFNELLII